MSQTLDNLSYTWNNAGTTFTGIKYNVTDTASASGSLLMDLQVGGTSKLKVGKDGAFRASGTGNALFSVVDHSLLLLNTHRFDSYSGNTTVYPNGSIGWANAGLTTSNPTVDVALWRDAANTFAQRNSTNAQTHRTYGTYTDGSNYRRLTQTMSTGGVAEIKPEGAGTGASGNVLHISGLPTSNPGPGILWNDAGTVKVGT